MLLLYYKLSIILKVLNPDINIFTNKDKKLKIISLGH